jgi:hypothetical protein
MPKTIDIFVRTYSNDYGWLAYLLRSIERFGVTGFRRVVIVHRKHDDPPPAPNVPHVMLDDTREYKNDYHGQAITKLRAHEFTDADVVFYVDSDCVFCQPLDLQAWEYPFLVTPWEKLKIDTHGGSALCWYDTTKLVLGFDPPFETMRRFPFVYPVDFVREVYEHVGGLERLTKLLEEGMPNISEFNILGNYACAKYPERFKPLRTDEVPLPPLVVRQMWSPAGLNSPLVQKEMAALGLQEMAALGLLP